MEQLSNILELRVRLESGALVEIPRENPLLMLQEHAGSILVVHLVEKTGVLRTLSVVEPAHHAVVVVEGNYIHWCMVTTKELSKFAKSAPGRTETNSNIMLRRAPDDGETVRVALPYSVADNMLTVAEAECQLAIDTATGALLSSPRKNKKESLVSARLLFATNWQRDSGLWKSGQALEVQTRGFVRSDVSNNELLGRILAPRPDAPPVEAVPPLTGVAKTATKYPVPSMYVDAELQIDEQTLTDIAEMAVTPDWRHVIYRKDGTPIEVSPVIWHAIDAVRGGSEDSPALATGEIDRTFSKPGFADVHATAADEIYFGFEFGYVSLDAPPKRFVLVTNEFTKDGDPSETVLYVSGFDFYAMAEFAGLKSYGTVFISPDVIKEQRVSFVKRGLKIGDFGSVFSAVIPSADAARLTEDIRLLNSSS